jgi:nucleotide-binding universal stress UspA family protein
MVNLEVGRSNKSILRVAGDLAERIGAEVLGIAVCQPMQIVYYDGLYSACEIEQDEAEIEKELKVASAEFHDLLEACTRRLEWRANITYAPLAADLARNARAADIIITGVGQSETSMSRWRRAKAGDLVMAAGRPVVIVPASTAGLDLRHALIAWKDTREARRSVVDALPLLRIAARVSAVEVAPEAELTSARARLREVADWLGTHGVACDYMAWPATGDDAFDLSTVAEGAQADIIVAGAYGHGRLREWAIGGVTLDLLSRAERCALLSH